VAGALRGWPAGLRREGMPLARHWTAARPRDPARDADRRASGYSGDADAQVLSAQGQAYTF